jgi:hypothetical protein
MEKRRRVDDRDQDDAADDCLSSEEAKEVDEIVESFFSVGTSEKTTLDEEKRSKLERKLRERRIPPPLQPASTETADVVDDFDDELSFLFRENVGLEGEKDIRKIDALYAKNLPYLS